MNVSASSLCRSNGSNSVAVRVIEDGITKSAGNPFAMRLLNVVRSDAAVGVGGGGINWTVSLTFARGVMKIGIESALDPTLFTVLTFTTPL